MIAASLVALLGAAQGAGAGASPLAPPCCPTSTALFTSTGPVAIPDNSFVTTNISVSGVGAYLWRADFSAFIAHAASGQLVVTLTSPAGTVVTLTSNNGGAAANVFMGTVWTDGAGAVAPPGPVTDTVFASGAAPPALCPEEAMAAFKGQNPNGVWTVRFTDSAPGVAGSASSLALRLTTCAAPPATALTMLTNSTPRPIPNPGTTESMLLVSGIGATLVNLQLRTVITHSFSGDLVITLISPRGTESTITSRNGGAAQNVFNGTLWRDDAGATNPPGPVTDHVFVSQIVASPLCPEEALGAFDGEDPNGVWSLRVQDAAASDSGVLNSWTLSLFTCGDPPCDADLNGDGVVNASDLGLLLTRWGPCP